MSLNTEEFLQTTTEVSLDDVIEPCPAGEYIAVASQPEVASFTYKQGDREGQTGYRMIVKWDVQDDGVKQTLDRDKVTVTQSVLLDITPDGNALDFGKGKNIGLGQIRSALGQNQDGQPWSPAMIEGQPAKIKVKAGVYNDRVTAEVAGVTAP